MELIIIMPDKNIFEGEVEKVALPGGAGEFQVLHSHAPLVSTLVKGNIRYGEGKNAQILPIEKGLVEVFENRITVLLTSPANPANPAKN